MKSIKCIIVALLAGLLAVLPGIQTAQAARTFNGTSDYIEAGSAVVTAEPLTMACWFRASDVTNSYVLMSVGDFASISRCQMTASGATAGDPVRIASVNAAGASGVAATSSGYTAGQWYHAAGVVSSSSNRMVYINGGSEGSDTSAITLATPTRTAVGAGRYNSSTNSPFAGDIAEAAIWNAALSAVEIASLAKGFSPRQIRPQSLVFYAPLVRSVTDIRGGVALTDTVPTTAASSHPPVRN